MSWKFTQVFGENSNENQVTKDDMVSSLAFSQKGEFLSLGDYAGRVILFTNDTIQKGSKEYTLLNYHTEFQANKKGFDIYNSTDIHEKVNCLEWVDLGTPSLFLFCSQDETVKLWKIPREPIKTTRFEPEQKPKARLSLHVPNVKCLQKVSTPVLKRKFFPLNGSIIKSISASVDGQTFATFDDIGVYLWNIERTDSNYLIYGSTDKNQQSEISSGHFHPESDNLIICSLVKGPIQILDQRFSCEAKSPSISLQSFPSGSKNFFSDAIAFNSDAVFCKESRFVYSRDVLSVKVWDLAKPTEPVKVLPIYEPLKSRLDKMYEEDLIYDKFSLSLSPCGKFALTGCYNKAIHILNVNDDENIQYTLNFSRKTLKRAISCKSVEFLPDNYSFDKKVLNAVWHPNRSTFVAASLNSLFVYN